MNRTARVLVATIAVAGAFTLSGCKAVEKGIKAISPTTSTAVGQTAPAGGGDPNANAVSCTTERPMFQLAVDSYTMLENKPPASEAALVPDYLVAESKLMDLAADGTVVAAPNSGC